MRAVTVSRFVSPHVLVIRDVPEPRASPGGVVVAIEAISVLWVETLIRPGCAGEYFDVTPPYVPGNAVVGVVREVGPDLDPGWAGRSVVARLDNGPWVRPASRDRGRDAGPRTRRDRRPGRGGAVPRRGHRAGASPKLRRASGEPAHDAMGWAGHHVHPGSTYSRQRPRR
jgi:hypothetical protein